jgi:hypothetical protein
MCPCQGGGGNPRDRIASPVLAVIPVLALVDPRFVPGPMLLAGSVLAAVTAYQDPDAIDARGLATSVIGMAGGTLIGAAALHFVHGRNVGHLFGYAILVLVSVLGVPIATNRRCLILGGGAAGVMGTMAGIHGPARAVPGRCRWSRCEGGSLT